jgi:succinate dehydrogenase/fumarate reductase cytochrome b subunit
MKRIICLLLCLPIIAQAQFVDVQQTQEYLNTTTVINKVDDIVNIFLAIIFIASIFGFIFSVIQYAIAGGSEKALDKARATRNVALIGSALALVAYIIIKLMQFFLS